jgi:DNA repair protein RadC
MIFPASPALGLGLPTGNALSAHRARARPSSAAALRILTLEARSLADHELLEVLLEPGLGSARAREGAARLLDGFPSEDGRGALRRVGRAAPQELVGVGGITPAAAARVLAALELGRRFTWEPAGDRCRLETARDVYERFYPRLRDLTQEEFWVLVLNTQMELLRETMVGRGTPTEVLVRPADVLLPAVQEGGGPIVVVHNHPSGEPAASPQDRMLTWRLHDAAALLGVELWDHVIIGERRYESFRDAGILTRKAARQKKKRRGAARGGARQ